MMTERGGKRGNGATAVRTRHIPVLLSEVLATLQPRAGGTYIDATFGAGGYTRAILEAGAARVVAIDRDPSAIAVGEALAQEFAGRLSLAGARFGALDEVARAGGAEAVDGVVLDVGVSSMQLDEAARGFSFQAAGPLDMRMSGEGRSAGDVVNEESEARLADILFRLGEERRSRAIARAIVRSRETKPLTTTAELADLVRGVLGRARDEAQHPATRTFQALRIYVNDELDELAHALNAAERILQPGGRLVVVSFHSLEDRIVKRFLTARSGRAPAQSRHHPVAAEPARASSFRIINRQPLTTSQGEAAANPRARSARLRAAERTEAPAWPPDDFAELGVPQL